ncbi:hypothetical protein [Psychromonas sp. MME2]|uniref:hypothetical protein n=1 Tax=unclassified Psychromonas TaxID=2614957 RepID=UPI00339BD7AB
MDKYREHGTYNIDIDSNTLIIDAKGPFNLELITHYHADLCNSVEWLAVNVGVWDQIIILHEESLFTPDAAQKLTEVNLWKKTKGLDRSAIVLINPIGSLLISKQLEKLYREAGVKIQMFDNMVAAKRWLAQPNEANM